MPGGKRVGGGGRIANRPPPGGARKDSRIGDQSAAGLAIDTASSHSRAQPSVANSNQDGVFSF